VEKGLSSIDKDAIIDTEPEVSADFFAKHLFILHPLFQQLMGYFFKR